MRLNPFKRPTVSVYDMELPYTIQSDNGGDTARQDRLMRTMLDRSRLPVREWDSVKNIFLVIRARSYQTYCTMCSRARLDPIGSITFDLVQTTYRIHLLQGGEKIQIE